MAVSDRNDAETDDRAANEGNASGRDIRFLKEKKRKGSGALVFGLLLLVLGVAYALWFRAAFAPPVPSGAVVSSELAGGYLVDRFWLDTIPERETDKFNVYFFSSEEGVALNDQALSVYKHVLELFFYKASGRDLQYQFPHDRRSGKTAYTVEKLQRPEKYDIDLKLTLAADPQAGGQAKVYFSSTKWSSLDKSTLPPLLQHLPSPPHEKP